MKERPIIFNSEMVKAILDGRKTETRRPVKIDSPTLEFDTCNPPWPTCADKYGEFGRVPCPWGKPGDRIWVRETWAEKVQNIGVEDIDFELHCEKFGRYFYKADDCKIFFNIKWKPSIHMPRWASRITLEITDVRVERVQEISDEDAEKEGCCIKLEPHEFPNRIVAPRFKELWNSIYTKKGLDWDDNPWVWVIEYRRLP